MAQVLAPIVQTSGPITMLHSSSDAFPNPSPTTQPHSARSSQMPRNQHYNPPSQGAGYRGTSTPIAPYAFASTPQLRQDARSSSAPLVSTRLPHQTHTSSSSESASSTSGSSSRSAAAAPFPATSKDDTMLTLDAKKLALDGLPGSSINLSTAVPDLSLSLLDSPVKPSPDRYRRAARRTDSSTSASSGTVTPTQSTFAPSVAATAGSVRSNPVTDYQTPTRPGHNRASSVDDMQPPRQGSVDQAKRYRRRSLSNLDAATDLATSVPSEFVPHVAVPVLQASQDTRPLAAPVRPNSRPNSSSGHERQDSAGSASSATSNRPSVCRLPIAIRAPANHAPVLPARLQHGSSEGALFFSKGAT